MSGFTCPVCNKQLLSKKSMNYHIDNKVCERMGKHKCPYCNEEYSSSQSLSRHKKSYCKVKRGLDNNESLESNGLSENNEENVNLINNCSPIDINMHMIYQRLLKLEKDNNILKKENSILKKVTGVEDINGNETKSGKIVKSNKKAVFKKVIKNNTNNTNNNNTNNTQNINNGMINNNIILVGYGKEDMSKIDYSDIIKCVSNGFDSPLKMIEMVHFNPKYPEFHNIYIPNMNNNYAMKYDGESWTLVPRQETIDGLYDRKKNYIEENIEDFIKSLSTSKKNSLNRWLDSDDAHDYVKTLKENIKLLLYNKRHIVMNTRSKIENKGINETV